MDKRGALQTIHTLDAVKASKGALSAEEQKVYAEAWEVLDGACLIYEAWLSPLDDGPLGEGNSEESAVEDAINTFEKLIGYDEFFPTKEAVIAALNIEFRLAEED